MRFVAMYLRYNLGRGRWVITDAGTNYSRPQKAVTFAFDTENVVMLDGVIMSQTELFERLKGVSTADKRKRVTSRVWSWQTFDEYNGFFMTNDFETWLDWQCRCGYKFGWCYNAKFDFSQVDYQILTSKRWKPHSDELNTKAQPWTYESIHNDMGARYAYKLWVPYKRKGGKRGDYHRRTHAVEYRDFMNIFAGGLAKMLAALDVRDGNGEPVRKLSMDYQAVNIDKPSHEDVDYCRVDVVGLYYGVKQYNATIEEQSAGESHIFGKETNIMTAGGFAKRELLRSMYPDKVPKHRLQAFQREHPLTREQDEWLRKNHLYRGGIAYVNKAMQGRLLTAEKMGRPMKRYDVNSEYPFAMAYMRDLVGAPRRIKLREWLEKTDAGREEFEAVYMLTSVFGTVRPGMLGVWFNPFEREFVDVIDEQGLHLMFERELLELSEWYDLEYTCDEVLIWQRGEHAFAPFVNENYALKAEAKKLKNPALSAVVKLKLNSSYGKLAERVEREKGVYELSEETGAVHFVRTGTEVDEKCIMNVALGALCTSVARCWILSHIREICGPNVAETFVYMDTDSIHAFCPEYNKADAFELGAFKDEATCDACIYLAPKTYIDIEHVENGLVEGIEAHTKGINVRAVYEAIGKQKPLTIKILTSIFRYGAKFTCLCAMNVKGGKVLLPTEKELANVRLAPDGLTWNYGYDGQYLSEV